MRSLRAQQQKDVAKRGHSSLSEEGQIVVGTMYTTTLLVKLTESPPGLLGASKILGKEAKILFFVMNYDIFSTF